MSTAIADELAAQRWAHWADIHMDGLRRELESLNITLNHVILDHERLEELRRMSEQLEHLLAFAVAADVQNQAREVA